MTSPVPTLNLACPSKASFFSFDQNPVLASLPMGHGVKFSPVPPAYLETQNYREMQAAGQ
jgi:hypothetical protein